MNTDSFLKEIGRSYLVSAFLPSAFFVSAAILLFRGFIPETMMEQFAENAPFPDQQWLLVLFIVFWVAFFLYSANDVTVKIFEGYFFPDIISDLLTKPLKDVWDKKYKTHLNRYLQIKELRKKPGFTQTDELGKEFAHRFRLALREQQELDLAGPFDKENLMPTRLGRVLRASEVYTNERYMREELVIWPRLIPTLPRSMATTLEEKHNHLMFLLNSALLTLINSVTCLFFASAGTFCSIKQTNAACSFVIGRPDFFHSGYNFISPTGYLLLSIAMVTFGYILYRIGVNVAEEMGMYIRASFDLYRLNVLQQMNLRLPDGLSDERSMWQDVSTFLISGTRMKDIEKLTTLSRYVYHEKINKNASEAPDAEIISQLSE